MEFFLLRPAAIVAGLNSAASLLLLSLALSSCGINGSTSVEEKALGDCSHKRTIEGLGFYFNHYPYPEIETIQLKVNEEHDIEKGWERFHVPEGMVDTSRGQRYFYFDKAIDISDTVLIKLKNGGTHTINGFTYSLRPHATTSSVWYGCDLYGLNMDGVKQTGGAVSIFFRKR